MNPNILTVSGKDFYFTDPENFEYGIEEIAHALSMNCRFGGHCREFYSVAQHSVHVAELTESESQIPDTWFKDKLEGLLHDASEAYLGDVPSPLKSLLPEYKKLENRVEKAIRKHFGLEGDKPPSCVKEADMIALITESRDLIDGNGIKWMGNPTLQPDILTITPLPPKRAEQLFLDHYEDLTNALNEYRKAD